MVTSPDNFEELEIYQAARELRRGIFRLSHFLPDQAPFSLADQMRHLALTITNNIAESAGIKEAEENPAGLYQKAQNSLLLLLDNLNLCLDEGYYAEEYLLALKKEAKHLQKKLEKNLKITRKTGKR